MITFMTDIDKQELREQINDISEDVGQLSKETADASAINDGAITPPKTSFFETLNIEPVNLLDLSKVTHGKYVSTDGNLSDSADFNVTDFIPVKPGDVLRLQAQFVETSKRFDLETSPNYGYLAYSALYDENKEFIADTHIITAPTLVIEEQNARYCRISLSNIMLNWVNVMIFSGESPAIVPYQPYFEPYVEHKIKKKYKYTDELSAFLPPEICIAEDRTIELYKQQILPNAEKYHFKLDAKYQQGVLGRNFQRKMSFYGRNGWCVNNVAAPIGLTIYNDDMDAVWSGFTTLRYKTALSNPKTVCCIGDSLTNGKAWLAEIINLSDGNLSLVGTRAFSIEDADGVTRAGYHEGRSGWSAARYNQPGDAEPSDAEFKYANPFYNADVGHFDWGYYVTNSLGGVSPDAVMLWLGTNGIALDATNNAAAIKALVDYIRTDDANIPIFCAYTIYPGDQNALGAQDGSDGYATNDGAWQYEEYKKVFNLCVKLTETMGDYANLYFVPLATCHDSEYNYGAIETPANPRAEQMVNMPIEAIHPQTQGYYQIADVVFGSLSVHLGD